MVPVDPRRGGLGQPAALLVQGHPGPQDRQKTSGHRHLAAQHPGRRRSPAPARRQGPRQHHAVLRRHHGLRVHVGRRGRRPPAGRPGRLRHRGVGCHARAHRRHRRLPRRARRRRRVHPQPGGRTRLAAQDAATARSADSAPADPPGRLDNASPPRGRVPWPPATDAEGATPLRQPLRHPGPRGATMPLESGEFDRLGRTSPPMGKGARHDRPACRISQAPATGRRQRGRTASVRRSERPSRVRCSSPPRQRTPPAPVRRPAHRPGRRRHRDDARGHRRGHPRRARRKGASRGHSRRADRRRAWPRASISCRRPPPRSSPSPNCARWPTPTPSRCR